MLELIIMFITGVMLKQYFTAHEINGVLKFVYYIGYATLIIPGLATQDLNISDIRYTMLYIIVGLLCAGIIWIISKMARIEESKIGALISTVSLVNSGIILSVAAKSYPITLISLFLAGDIVLLPIILWIAKRYNPEKKELDFLSVMKSPLMLFLIIGLLMNFFKIPILFPSIIKPLAEATPLIIMFLLGMLAKITWEPWTIIGSIIRVIIGSMLGGGLGILMGLDGKLSAVLSGASAGFVGVLYSKQENLDITLASNIASFSIVLYIIMALLIGL